MSGQLRLTSGNYCAVMISLHILVSGMGSMMVKQLIAKSLPSPYRLSRY